MKLPAMVRLIRPHQWVKNTIVLLPVVFAQRLGDPTAWARAAVAAGAFCLASGAVYIFNDIRDRQADRLHKQKKNRPIAAGDVSVGSAAGLAVALVLIAATVATVLSPMVGALIGAYLLLQACYCLYLKRKMLLDVICIAIGFVLRAVAGAAAIKVEASPWLITCAFTLCMFLGFCKRRGELVTIGQSNLAIEYRATLAGYNPELLSHLITMSATVAVLSFLQYATHPDTVGRFGTIYLAYTLPLVIYAVFRLAMLSIWARYDDPTELILRDRPFQFTVALWMAAAMAIVAWGADIQEYIRGRH